MKTKSIFLIHMSAFFIFTLIGELHAAKLWKPYVCKVTDFYECNDGKKQIFPVSERYSDKETCYEEFENLLETDKELDRKYPQTNDPNTSYIFGCVKE